MYLREISSIVLTWVLAIAVIAIDTRIAHADEDFIAWLCSLNPALCSPPGGVRGPGGTGPTWLPTPTEIAKIQQRINQGKGTTDDHLIYAYVLRIEKNYSQAEAMYLQGIKLAEDQKDIQRIAIANAELGKLYAATGKPEVALVRLRAAKTQFESLGNMQGVNQINKLEIGVQRDIQKLRINVPSDIQKLRIDVPRNIPR